MLGNPKYQQRLQTLLQSVQSASPGKILNLWYLVDLDLPIFKYFSRRKYSPVEIVCPYPSVSSFSAIPFSLAFKIYTGPFESSDTNSTNDRIYTNSNAFSYWSISSASRSHSSSWQTDQTGGIDSLLVSDNFEQLLKSSCRHCKQSQRYSWHNIFLLLGL